MSQILNLSIVFTDLVDSTAIATSVAPDAAERLRREHFGVLRKAVAEAGGREVKSLGDGLMIVFPTASAALACAAGMQQATELDNRSRDVPFGLRVGVSSGEVSEDDGDYFGEPVVEAARLCARCEAGQILSTEVTRTLAGRRGPFTYAALGDLDLKGLPEPVPVVELQWAPLAAESAQRVPLPTRLAGAPPAGVIGRAPELEMLAAATKRVAAGDGREVVIVAGEAGLGKTTLVADTARTAFADGACVLFGHAEEDLATPYGVFVEALGHLITHGPEDELRAHVAECGPDLARLVPALTRRLPDVAVPPVSDGETERYQMFTATVGLLRRVSAERPVVLVVDDIQWADSASLQLLRHIAAEDGLRLLVLATYRDTEVSNGQALTNTLAAFWRMERVSRVDLRGLDDRGVIDLLASIAGHDLNDAGLGLAHLVYRETDGNPFFVTEVLRNLAETGALYQDESGRWVSDLTLDELRLPDSVREVIGARVERLGPNAARVLATAAIIGRDFDLELLARAAELDEDDLLDLLEAAEVAGLVREPPAVSGRYTFTHALIQRTLYQDLGTTRRARTHLRVATALEEMTAGSDERIGELAHHWAQATRPTDVTKAVDYAARAGDAALAALAPDDAVRWYAQALELLRHDGDPRRRAELLVGLGDAQLQAGMPDYRTTLLDAAHLADALDDVDLLARAALANNRGFMSIIGGADPERLDVIHRALDRLGDDQPAVRARLLAVGAVEETYLTSLDARLAQVREAIALARASGDPEAFVQTALQACIAAHTPWTLDERLEWATEAVRIADRLGNPAGQYNARSGLGQAFTEAGRRDELDELMRVREQLIERLPRRYRWNHAFELTCVAFLDGDLERAERLAEEALAVATEHGEPDAFTVYSVEFACLRESQGRFGELVPLLEETLRQTPGLSSMRAVLTQACADAGDLDRCRELLATDRATGLVNSEDASWLNSQMQWAKAAIAVDDRETAVVVLDRMKPFEDQLVFTTLTVSPSAGHYVGRLEHMLGRLDDADATFARAHAFHRNLRAPQLVARTEVRWAQMLVDRARNDDHARARSLAEAARDASAGRPGWDWIARDAQAILDRAGGTATA